MTSARKERRADQLPSRFVPPCERGHTRPMRLYFAGPLFSMPERAWNAEVVAALRAAGHEIFLPQEKERGLDAAGIFAADVGGIDRAEGLVAIMDGLDPDAGTSWEVGYAYASTKPIVLVRTDFRDLAGAADWYNPLLAESATVRLDMPAASTTEVITAILEALSTIERDRLGNGATPS
jgi:nucleoside 2-deoxyribosyltransferase